ncbi:hypothetical protein [Enterococcus rotai]|uniref:hypothetical protein n=1 Tax=Enterococcus rotai TaxID=118060 RepID=UPI0032B4C4C8
MAEIYVLDQDVIISEEFYSVEQLLEEIGTSTNFIDIQIDGEKKRLNKGIDY